MNKFKIVLLCLSFLNYFNASSQRYSPLCFENSYYGKFHLSLGLKKYGVGLGNFEQYNGFNFNLLNRTCRLNGALFTMFSKSVFMNGMQVAAIQAKAAKLNGLAIGGITSSLDTLNGIQLTSIISFNKVLNGVNVSFRNDASRLNGVSFCGLTKSKVINGAFFSFGISVIDTARGVFISGYTTVTKSTKGVSINGVLFGASEMRGLTIAPINLSFKRVHGVQIGLWNKTLRLHGVQIGLLNKAGNNKRPFRKTPIINFHFDKKEKSP